MTGIADAFRSHLRIAILRALSDSPAYRANDSLLRDLVEGVHIVATRDQVRSELAWLAEQGLVEAEQTRSGALLAVLTERGGDVAAGRVVHPGVKKPSPGSVAAAALGAAARIGRGELDV